MVNPFRDRVGMPTRFRGRIHFDEFACGWFALDEGLEGEFARLHQSAIVGLQG
jgi:hypothetical protein